MAVIPQLLHVLRCLNSATLQKSVCSCVPEKEDNCFIHPDRKGNNEQRGTNKGSKMLVVEEMKTEWKTLSMYRIEEIVLLVGLSRTRHS